MNQLLMKYGFNIMEYKVMEDHPTYFVVLSHLTGNTYKIEKENKHEE